MTQTKTSLLVLTLILAACGFDVEPVISEVTVTTPPSSATSDSLVAPGDVTPPLVVECSGKALNDDDRFAFSVAHRVVNGELEEEPCFGVSNPILTEAWDLLADFAPRSDRRSLALFTGFDGTDEEGDETVAFVVALGPEGDQFQMAINLDRAGENREELILTLAHEFSHVFTGTPDQLDRFSDPSACATWDNGEGCYLADSLLAEWIGAFWAEDYLDSLDVNSEPTIEGGEDRCGSDPGFFGPYAASSPEEDFAETFSAFVTRVSPLTPAQEVRLEWMAENADLQVYQDLAISNDIGPLTNTFEVCGADR